MELNTTEKSASQVTTPTTESLAIIVLAAGAGTRMKSRTPKTLHAIGGRTLLAHSLHAAMGLHPHLLITVVGHGRELVSPAVDLIGAQTGHSIHQCIQEEQRGTGHAVQCALPALEGFEGTVIVSNADVPLLRSDTLAQLHAAHSSTASAVTVLSVHQEDPTGYGRIIRSTSGEVTAIVEEKDATEDQRAITEVNSGVFAFDASVLRTALSLLTTDNAQGELYLTDVVALARQQHHPVHAYQASDASELAGVNDRVQLAAAGAVLNQRILTDAMRAGVTVIDPRSTMIDCTVTFGTDVTLYPGVQLQGTTHIADGASVGPDSTLMNVQVGQDSHVTRTHGVDARIGARCEVGPFSYLRPGTVLGDEGKLGGFVESKNATIGRGTKVPHLTYVGDATIGDYSNIGASSVFVNYDGVAKHHTTVGSHVRTGSDTMFIAPVTVGDGAYSGAGTVIKNDVPPGALTVTESRQRIIEGWVGSKRAGTESAQAAETAIRRVVEGGCPASAPSSVQSDL